MLWDGAVLVYDYNAVVDPLAIHLFDERTRLNAVSPDQSPCRNLLARFELDVVLTGFRDLGVTLSGVISDAPVTAYREDLFKILQADGTPIGSTTALGISGGTPPPGSAPSQTGGDWAITGGTVSFRQRCVIEPAFA